MKQIWRAAALCLLCTLIATPALADTLSVQGLAVHTETLPDVPLDGTMPSMPETIDAQWVTAFHALYPDTKLLVTRNGSDSPDVLVLDSAHQDVQALMASGALLDLTDDPGVAQIIAQLHPSIAQAAYHDGRLYGVPIAVYAGYQVRCLQTEWAYAGYAAEDFPTSFEGLLDFLDAWVQRCQTDTYSTFWSIIHHESTGYAAIRQPHGYTGWLTTILVRNHLLQCRAQGITPVFNTPVVLALLERAQAVGKALYANDHRTTASSLFADNINAASREMDESLFYQLPPRLTDDDPLLMPLHIRLLAVNSQTQNHEQAVALIKAYFGQLEGFALPDSPATLERDALLAAAPLLLRDWRTELSNAKNLYSICSRAQLYVGIADDLRAGRTDALQGRNLIQSEASIMRSAPLVAADWLERYQTTIVPGMVFPAAACFDAPEQKIETLITRFAQEKLTAVDFAAQLDALLAP